MLTRMPPAELTVRDDAHGHSHLEAMAAVIDAAAAGNRDAIKRFIEHGEAYIENEEDWLFPQANRVLDETKQQALEERLQGDDHEVRCDVCHEPFVEVANRLADHFGVPRAQRIEDPAT
jgi:hemerythrin-like domain-containing protein